MVLIPIILFFLQSINERLPFIINVVINFILCPGLELSWVGDGVGVVLELGRSWAGVELELGRSWAGVELGWTKKVLNHAVT